MYEAWQEDHPLAAAAKAALLAASAASDAHRQCLDGGNFGRGWITPSESSWSSDEEAYYKAQDEAKERKED